MTNFGFLKKFLLIFFFFLVVSTVRAETKQYCLNSTHLQKNNQIDVSGDVITTSELQYCDNGCSNNFFSCRPNYIFQIFIVLLTISFFLLVEAFAFSRSHGVGIAMTLISAACFLFLMLADFFEPMWRLFLVGGIVLVLANAWGELSSGGED